MYQQSRDAGVMNIWHGRISLNSRWCNASDKLCHKTESGGRIRRPDVSRQFSVTVPRSMFLDAFWTLLRKVGQTLAFNGTAVSVCGLLRIRIKEEEVIDVVVSNDFLDPGFGSPLVSKTKKTVCLPPAAIYYIQCSQLCIKVHYTITTYFYTTGSAESTK